MTPDQLRARLRRIAAEAHDPPVVYGEEIMGELEKPPTPAAVLVPIILSPAPSILLTKRTSHLKKHAGQVSFPGGRIDREDSGPEAAALREANEEVGLDPANVEVLGRMADYVTGTGYRITPIVGIIPHGLIYRPEPAEVEAVFEFPIATVIDPEAPRRSEEHTSELQSH